MNSYPLIRSTLEGLFGAQVATDDDSALNALRRDLTHLPFLLGIREELSTAFSDQSLSWQQMLDECDVETFDSEDEAESFVRQNLLNVVDSVSAE